MNEARTTHLSKYLAKYLRHAPERIGLTLEPGGWVNVVDLLVACAHQNVSLTRDELNEVVQNNNKQRFGFDPTGTKIRARQGHSIDVDLELAPAVPPQLLYHGTAQQTVPAILESGLQKMKRQHVHLSADPETARTVGARHGQPIVLRVSAKQMHDAGYAFYQADNGVWLTDAVPLHFVWGQMTFGTRFSLPTAAR